MTQEHMDRDQVGSEERNLIAPCGIYCGACDIFLGYSHHHAKELHRILDGFNFADVGPFLMGMEQQQIRDLLDLLLKWGERERCPGCWEGGGNPTCSIRACAQSQGFITCAECEQMPCDLLPAEDEHYSMDKARWFELITRRYAGWNIANLEQVREVGYRRFIDQMQDKVAHGFLTSNVISNEMVVTEAFRKMEEDQ